MCKKQMFLVVTVIILITTTIGSLNDSNPVMIQILDTVSSAGSLGQDHM